MKTLFLKIIPTCVGILLITLVACQAASAQQLIRVEIDDDASLHMQIADENVHECPNKVILIFDSTEITYEFDDLEAIALATIRSYSGSSSKQIAVEERRSAEATLANLDRLMKTVVLEPVEEDEEIKTEEWMYSPQTWLQD